MVSGQNEEENTKLEVKLKEVQTEEMELTGNKKKQRGRSRNWWEWRRKCRWKLCRWRKKWKKCGCVVGMNEIKYDENQTMW